ncbi:MAG: class I SAM-dependent methyltransferase [Verrucomicrobiota bacterium]|nr:class I SAM-dependent methyltransferase [Verrucomicrobiota bacterium]
MSKTKPFDLYPERYELWFQKNHCVFQSEINAVKKIIPDFRNGIEVGIGSGLFAVPLGIPKGVEPSLVMRQKAEKKGLCVIDSVAEDLPYLSESKDLVLMITTVCFLDDIVQAFAEVHRVLKKDGSFIIGFVDKNSPLGQKYLRNKEKSVFYKDATFYGTEELLGILKDTGFKTTEIVQTIFGELEKINTIQEVLSGFGKGSFVVCKNLKNNKI